jgi:hypothetical protein
MTIETMQGGPLDGRTLEVPEGIAAIVVPLSSSRYVKTADGFVWDGAPDEHDEERS